MRAMRVRFGETDQLIIFVGTRSAIAIRRLDVDRAAVEKASREDICLCSVVVNPR
jgi:hypothetical protein